MQLKGIHHLALFTSNMDETVRFWTNVLKAKLVRAGQDTEDPGLRQYYFDVGGAMIAFFDFPAQDRETLQFGWMHRLALKAGSPKELEAWRKHIASFNVPVSDIRQQDFRASIVLHDPNGVLIEIAAATRKPTKDDLKKDPKPVLALREMLK
jgi:catechol 2,3-dioxygenase-like lactoylglutathione lyase family enzyme